MRKFDIKLRPPGEVVKTRPKKELLEKLYFKENLTINDIAIKLNYNYSLMYRTFKEYNIISKKKGYWKVDNIEKRRKVAKKISITKRNLFLVPWNKNLTKETDNRIKRISNKKKEWHLTQNILGINNPFYGKHHTYECRCRLSLAKNGTGIPYEKKGYSSSFNNKLKQQVRQRNNHTCQMCGVKESYNIFLYNRRLDIHHIDYNKKNNDPNNLLSLCRNCHLQTNFGRSDWINYFNRKVN